MSVGLRTRTGRAIAVAVSGSRANPNGVKRAELLLAGPEEPDLFQPYHEILKRPWDEAQRYVQTITAAALQERAAEALRSFVDGLDCSVRRIGIVGAPERDLRRIGGRHIQAHAAEGLLFRQVWEAAAKATDTPHQTFNERGFEEFFASLMGLPVSEAQSRLAAIGQTLGRPWRADEKAAAMAAWLTLDR